MTLYCSVSSSAPATTHVIMGYVGHNSYYFDLETASTADKKIVTNFLGVVGLHYTVNVENYELDTTFEANIIIPGEADLEYTTTDYSSLTATKKTKVTAFVNLITNLVQSSNS